MKMGWYKIAIVSTGLLTAFFCKGILANQEGTGKPSKEQVVHSMQKLQVPFIANNGQVDKNVSFYAKTFGGTVFVTKDAEIVYALPNGSAGKLPVRGGNQHSENPNLQSPIMGVALKECLVGGKVNEIKGEAQAATTVNYFMGNDPEKWKSGLSTYNVVDMGDIYNGINLKLKAYGNNVEKLFTVTPDASPEAIQLGLSGQTVPNELRMDSLCAVKRYKIPFLPVVFSVTVQNILPIGYFMPFQRLSVPFPCSITCYSTSQSTSVSQLWSSFLLY